MIRPLQFHFGQKTYVFHFRAGFSLLCLALFCLCIALGCWQLHRYHTKKTLLANYQKHLTEPAQLFNSHSPVVPFQSIEVKGRYVNPLTVLIQNRFYHDELGFEVLTALQMPNDKRLLLVDRGWVKKINAPLPVIESIAAPQHLTGHIKLLDEYQFILGKNSYTPEKRPLVVQRIDVKELSQWTHQDFYPFLLRLNANEPGGYVRDWTIVTVTPERHMAYTVQWFALALVLLIAYFCFCCEKISKEEHSNAKNIS